MSRVWLGAFQSFFNFQRLILENPFPKTSSSVPIQWAWGPSGPGDSVRLFLLILGVVVRWAHRGEGGSCQAWEEPGGIL